MEVIAFLTLAVAGYIVNKRRAAHGPLHTGYQTTQAESDADEDLYETRQIKRAQRAEFDAATRAHLKSMAPRRSAVIPRNQDQERVSLLSGMPTDFSHSNMKPFFGGHVRQTLNPSAYSSILEQFTGATPGGGVPPAAKVERAPLFSPAVGNVYGTPSIDLEAAIERLPIQRFKNNDLPFQQVTVGPAIGGGYTSTPGDGYLTGREYQLPKAVDELRTLDNPKVSYTGRTIAGAELVQSRGELGTVDEPRYPQRYRETFSSEDWMKTTGQNLGTASRPTQLLRDVMRPETHVSYSGGPGPTPLSTATYTGQGEQSEPHRSECLRLQLGPASAALAADRGAAVRADFGRANILVYSNERDTTNVPVFSGSTSTVVKSIIAPLLDMVRPARRQVLGTDAPRAFGNVSVMIPEKQTVRDPDGVLRTTIRETTQHFTANPGALGALRGPTVLPVYDPSDIAKTTLKEQTIHDGSGPDHTAPAPGVRRTMMRDPDDAARTTTRQTLGYTSTSVNPSATSKGLLLRDPDLHMRDTVKQTTVAAANAETDGTAVGGIQGDRGGYTSADMTPFATTTRQFLQDDGHLGTAGTAVMTTNDGYRVANAFPRNTQKQVLSDNSYFGVGRQQGAGDAPSSHEEYEHATIRPDKEILSVMGQRDFVPAGYGKTLGKDDIDSGEVRKFNIAAGVDEWTPAVGRIMPPTGDTSSLGLPEAGSDNTFGLNPHEGTRGLRGTYAHEMALPTSRFDEDISAMGVARALNATANPSFFSGK